jgi:hypothetical protein
MSEWLYLQNGRTIGPVSESKIVDMMVALELDFDTNVMSSNDGLWKKIRDVKTLMDKFNTPSVTINCAELPSIEVQNLGTVEIPHNVYFYIPIKRLILMTFVTFGFYQLYWWYKQWSYWAYKRKQVRSFDREAGWFLFPLIVLDKIQLDEELNKVERANFDGQSLFFAWLLLCFLGSLPFMFFHIQSTFDPTMFGGAFSISVLLLIPPQRYINRVNAKLGNEYDKPGFGHYACLVVGIFLWIGTIINLVKYLAAN